MMTAIAVAHSNATPATDATCTTVPLGVNFSICNQDGRAITGAYDAVSAVALRQSSHLTSGTAVIKAGPTSARNNNAMAAE